MSLIFIQTLIKIITMTDIINITMIEIIINFIALMVIDFRSNQFNNYFDLIDHYINSFIAIVADFTITTTTH